MLTDQNDLFGSAQGELFAPASAPQYRPDPDKVRRRLESILAKARAAATMPWDWAQLSLYKTIFPQMTRWLPEEEAAQYRLAFDAELARLEAAEARVGGSSR